MASQIVPHDPMYSKVRALFEEQAGAEEESIIPGTRLSLETGTRGNTCAYLYSENVRFQLGNTTNETNGTLRSILQYSKGIPAYSWKLLAERITASQGGHTLFGLVVMEDAKFFLDDGKDMMFLGEHHIDAQLLASVPTENLLKRGEDVHV